ncbi:MAG: hypothetical protein J0M25_09155 [Flavobacteriales bacterium]|nr:hypothetical protein [Flavobacteriales bacterium]
MVSLTTNFCASASSFFCLILDKENAETFGSVERGGITGFGFSIVFSGTVGFGVSILTFGTTSTEVLATSIAPNFPRK